MTLSDAQAASSVNVPVGSDIYEDLETLEVKGLLKSGMLATKPFSRIEAARLVDEASEALRTSKKPETAPELTRLRKALRDRLEGRSGPSVKPVERAYLRFLYSNGDPRFPDADNNGDEFTEGASLRAGFDFRIETEDIAFFARPEYRADREQSEWRLVHGYAIASMGNVEVLAGRDSMWWGSGYHGSLLLTDNARPFDMLKATSQYPFTLPWVFSRLGLFKPTVFLTRLENDRDFPKANLLGMRFDFKPHPSFQFGLTRVFMFGGHGRRSLGLSDWAKVFFASDAAEHNASPINGNQIASIDASFVYVNERPYVPLSGLKAYTEWGAEDSSGHTKTPSGRANIYGVLIDEPLWAKGVDLRVEWANTARNARYGPQWYTHWKYTDGYTHEGRIIGHHMGSDSRDLFIRAQYRFNGGVRAGAEADHERSAVHSLDGKKTWYGADFRYPVGDVALKAGIGREKTGSTAEADKRNTVLWFNVDYPL